MINANLNQSQSQALGLDSRIKVKFDTTHHATWLAPGTASSEAVFVAVGILDAAGLTLWNTDDENRAGEWQPVTDASDRSCPGDGETLATQRRVAGPTGPLDRLLSSLFSTIRSRPVRRAGGWLRK